MIAVIWVGNVPIGNLAIDTLAPLGFCLFYCTNFFRRITGVKLVEQRLFGKGKDKQAEIQYSCGFATGWLPKS